MARDWRDSYRTVRVWTRTQAGTDPMGEPTYAWTFEDVRGVCLKDGAATAFGQADSASDLRPDGVRVSYTLGFPRGCGISSLRHRRVTILDPEFGMDADEEKGWETALAVTGDPRPDPGRTTRWDLFAEVGRTDG